jgi:hypothetical protein
MTVPAPSSPTVEFQQATRRARDLLELDRWALCKPEPMQVGYLHTDVMPARTVAQYQRG